MQQLFIGLDLGGTNLKCGLSTSDGELLEKATYALVSKAPEAVIEQMVQVAGSLLAKRGVAWASVTGIGVCSPGQVQSGIVVAAASFESWHNVPVGAWLKRITGVQTVEIINDADAAAFGELLFGAGHGSPDSTIAIYTLGTGVGLGLILGGQAWRGANGLVEGGHQIVDASPEARPCPCGQRGCLEAYASATALAAIAAEKFGNKDGSSDSSNSDGAVTDITVEELFARHASGDAAASAVVREAARYLGLACLNTCRFVDPTAILFAGGVARADGLIPLVEKEFRRLGWSVLPHDCHIGLAETALEGGVLGAAAAAALAAAAARPCRRNIPSACATAAALCCGTFLVAVALWSTRQRRT